jgi:heme/copper-type cytochrome/quinol oxidase subunit 4
MSEKMNENLSHKRILSYAIPFFITWLLPIIAALYCEKNGIPAWSNSVKYLLLFLLFLVLVGFELFYFRLARTGQGALYSYLLTPGHAFVLTQLLLFDNLSNWLLSLLVCAAFFGMTLAFGYVSKRETGRFQGYNEFFILCLLFDVEAALIVLEENLRLFL